MPKFNVLGQVTPQIGYFWYDQNRLIFQDCSSGVCVLRLSDAKEAAPRGCNELCANGSGDWAAWLGGFGLFDSFGRVFPASGLAIDAAGAGAMGPDGSYAIKVLRNSFGPWDVIERDGARWRLTDGDARDVQILSGRRAIWTEGGFVRSNFALKGVPSGPVYSPRAADDGALLYQHRPEGALVLAGKIIGAPSASYFYPDVILIDGVYHVCWSPNQADTDAKVRTFTPVQLAALPDVSSIEAPTPIPIPAPPVPPPTHPPTPVPEPKPMSEPLAQIVKDIVARFVPQFPVPSGGPNPADDAFENRCRAWIKALAEQVRFSTNDPSYGVKNAGGGRPQSKDSLAHLVGGRLINYDMLTGVGTGSPSLVAEPGGDDITGQVFVPVEPIDHLKTVPVPAPGPAPTPDPPHEPPPAPAPPVDLSPLLAKLDDVQNTIRVCSANEIAKLDEIKVAFIKSGKEIGTVLQALATGGGLSSILGGVLGKTKK